MATGGQPTDGNPCYVW